MPSPRVSGNVDLTLYGPADIIGIDPRLVVRTDPEAERYATSSRTIWRSSISIRPTFRGC